MANVKIFTENIDNASIEQINELISLPVFEECKIRIMPDVHAGVGCVIGFTANLGEKVIPNIVGVDIGCGLSVAELNIKRDNITDDFLRDLDEVIHNYVPSGKNVHNTLVNSGIDYTQLRCYDAIVDRVEYFERSLGTLGGGKSDDCLRVA